MLKILSLPKPDKSQQKMMASIASDLGKLFFAAGVIGYFIPGLGTRISATQFLLGSVASMLLFMIAVFLSKEV